MWTEEEISILEKKYPFFSKEHLSEELGRSPSAVKSKASRLNIEKSHQYSKLRSIRRSENINTSEIKDYKIGFFVGFLSGEGTFSKKTENGRDKPRFAVSIELTREDEEVLHNIRDIVGCGSVYYTSKRKNNRKGGVKWTVQDYGDIYRRIIPILDEYDFMDSEKGSQYQDWRREVVKQVDKQNI